MPIRSLVSNTTETSQPFSLGNVIPLLPPTAHLNAILFYLSGKIGWLIFLNPTCIWHFWFGKSFIIERKLSPIFFTIMFHRLDVYFWNLEILKRKTIYIPCLFSKVVLNVVENFLSKTFQKRVTEKAAPALWIMSIKYFHSLAFIFDELTWREEKS